jgi:hypothetical protein
MRQHSRIRSSSRLGKMHLYPAQHPPFTRSPQNTVVRKMYPPEKINARRKSFDKNFVGMEGQFEPLAKKLVDLRYQVFKIFLIARKNRKIVSIPQIIFYPQVVFYKLIKLVHINIHKKLGSKISKRQPNTWRSRRKTVNHFAEQPANSLIGDISAQNIRENIVVDVREKFCTSGLFCLPRKNSNQASRIFSMLAMPSSVP